MKAGIHPDYQQTTIACACGNVIETGSTKKDIRVEVCSKCHPFYTGKQKMVDTGGRVSRFNKKFGLTRSKIAPEKAVPRSRCGFLSCQTQGGSDGALPHTIERMSREILIGGICHAQAHRSQGH